jgi:hypothetical protein
MPNKLKDPIHPKKAYNDRDWKAYDQALKNRGNITIWFCEDAVKQWNAPQEEYRKKGRPKTYSDLSIQTYQVFRSLFKQPLRQTEGLVTSIIRLLDLDLQTPDHTTLSRRLGKIKIPKKSQISEEPKVIVFDSTGLKVMGEREWMNYKHGTRQRKVWRKLHIAIEDGEIVAHTLTIHTISDTAEVMALVEQIDAPITETLGDGGYGHVATYAAIDKHNKNKSGNSTMITVPPNIGFQPIRDSDHQERIRNQKIIDEQGREYWERRTNYGRRKQVECTFSRWKRMLGGNIKAKNGNNQVGEMKIGVFM